MKPAEVHAKWGQVVEGLTDETRDAVRDVLMHLERQQRVEFEDSFEARILGVQASTAHAQNAYDMGKAQGFKEAVLALTDSEYIRDERKLLHDQFTKEK